jgi:hypothetical protein
VRTSLVIPIESRDGTLNKDSKLVNLMIDPLAPAKVMKRPGMWKQNLYAPAGNGDGIFAFNDIIYIWTDGGTGTGSGGGTGEPVTPCFGTIDDTHLAYVVTDYTVDTTDPQYFIATLAPYNPFDTGNLINSNNGFPLAKDYIVSLA